MNKLPDDLSELILVALEDLEKCEADPKYDICMGVWVYKYDPDVCSVCLAGAVMCQRIDPNLHDDLKVDVDMTPSSVTRDEHTRIRLRALDALRTGDLWSAYGIMGIDKKWLYDSFRVCPYSTSPLLFKHDMRLLAKYLAENGL